MQKTFSGRINLAFWLALSRPFMLPRRGRFSMVSIAAAGLTHFFVSQEAVNIRKRTYATLHIFQ